MSKPITIVGRTERPCSKCGVVKPMCEFYVSRASSDGHGNQCKPCAKLTARASALKNAERVRIRQSAWRKENSERLRENAKQYYAINALKIIERVRAWRKANPDKFATHAVTRVASTAVWRRTNPHKIAEWNETNKSLLRSNVAKRRAKRKNATPLWSDADAIRSFYKSADALNMLTGEWHHVDHIVPLQSPTVCGLHNQFNLQILTARENILKSNRYWPDKP
jgi:hypothetical protein